MGKSMKRKPRVEKLNVSYQWESLMQSNYGTPVISLIRGKGIEVWDSNGKKYLDFLGGIATNLLGHAHPVVSRAIATQAASLSHISNFYAHPTGLALAKNFLL
jgi:acetylornithine aminotransferase